MWLVNSCCHLKLSTATHWNFSSFWDHSLFTQNMVGPLCLWNIQVQNDHHVQCPFKCTANSMVNYCHLVARLQHSFTYPTSPKLGSELQRLGYLFHLLLLCWLGFPHSHAQCDLRQVVFNMWLITTSWLCIFCSFFGAPLRLMEWPVSARRCNAGFQRVFAYGSAVIYAPGLGITACYSPWRPTAGTVSSRQGKNKTRHWNKLGECDTFNFI